MTWRLRRRFASPKRHWSSHACCLRRVGGSGLSRMDSDNQVHRTAHRNQSGLVCRQNPRAPWVTPSRSRGSSGLGRNFPLIDRMSDGRGAAAGGYRQEFWWEREWRQRGDYFLPGTIICLCPEGEMDQFSSDGIRTRRLPTSWGCRLRRRISTSTRTGKRSRITLRNWQNRCARSSWQALIECPGAGLQSRWKAKTTSWRSRSPIVSLRSKSAALSSWDWRLPPRST